MKKSSFSMRLPAAARAVSALIAAAVMMLMTPIVQNNAYAVSAYTIYDGDFGYELDYSTGSFTATITDYRPEDITNANGTITIPDTVSVNKYPVTAIAPYTFANYTDKTKIETVKLPKDLVTISESAFAGCNYLSKLDLPKDLKTIGSSAFSGCTSLGELKLPDTVTDIGYAAFYGCTSIEKVTFSKDLKYIGQSAFSGCTSLTAVEIPENVTQIGSSAFEGCSRLASVVLPKGLTAIENYCFHNCTSLTTISIPASVEKIGIGAFENCLSLNAIDIPSGTKYIESSAFSNCTRLTTAVIPYDIESIFDDAFSNTPVTIWSYTGSYADSYASRNAIPFRSNGAIHRITFSADNRYATVNNIAISTGTGALLIPPSTVTTGTQLNISVTAPEGYEINYITINDSQFPNGSTYVVTDSDVNIFVSYRTKEVVTTTAATTTSESQLSTTTTATTPAPVTVADDRADTTQPIDDNSGDETGTESDDSYIKVNSDLEDVNHAKVRVVTQRNNFIAPATIRITNTEEAYASASSAADALGMDNAIYYAFDISLLDESGEENQAIMARGTIQFLFPVPNGLLPYLDSIKVYHIADDEPELLSSTVIEDISGVKRVQFEADSFSPYMLIAETSDEVVPIIDDEVPSDQSGSGIIQPVGGDDEPDASIVDDNQSSSGGSNIYPYYNGNINPHTGAIIAASLIPVVVLICILLARNSRKRKRTKNHIE